MSTSGDGTPSSSVTGRTHRFYEVAPLSDACFGAIMRFPVLSGAGEAVATFEAEPEALGAEICAWGVQLGAGQ